jgi:hypothetical protein
VSENERGSYSNKRKMRLMVKKRFKDDESGGPNNNHQRYQEENKDGGDTDMKILESDYSSSTFHLASRSSVHGK